MRITKNCNMLQFFAMSSKYNKSRLAPTFIVDFSVKICYNKIKIIKRSQANKNQGVKSGNTSQKYDYFSLLPDNPNGL